MTTVQVVRSSEAYAPGAGAAPLWRDSIYTNETVAQLSNDEFHVTRGRCSVGTSPPFAAVSRQQLSSSGLLAKVMRGVAWCGSLVRLRELYLSLIHI